MTKYNIEVDDDSKEIVNISSGEGVIIPPGCLIMLAILIIFTLLAYISDGFRDCTTWIQNPTGDWYCASNW